MFFFRQPSCELKIWHVPMKEIRKENEMNEKMSFPFIQLGGNLER